MLPVLINSFDHTNRDMRFLYKLANCVAVGHADYPQFIKNRSWAFQGLRHK